MNKNIIQLAASFITIAVLLWGCAESVPNIDEIILLETSTSMIVADGNSKATLTVFLPLDADEDKRTIKFETNLGMFSDSNRFKEVTATQKLASDEKLTAEVTFLAPSSPGIAEITATVSGYTRSTNIEINPSTVASLVLTASQFNVQENFASEVVITGRVLNSSGKNASQGVPVKLHDVYLSGQPVNGNYREQKLSSNGSGNVSAIYSPGFTSVNDSILYIIGTVLDNNGQPTNIKDSITLFITR